MGEENKVSIHAPAWGATWYCGNAAMRGTGFNPRARVGRDKLEDLIDSALNSFNPRARVGRDRCRRKPS